jgi:hypothetical protein
VATYHVFAVCNACEKPRAMAWFLLFFIFQITLASPPGFDLGRSIGLLLDLPESAKVSTCPLLELASCRSG